MKLLDARAVERSENRDLDEVIAGRDSIRVFNKSDLADEKKTGEWKRYFEEKGEKAFFVDSLSRKGLGEVVNHLMNMNRFRTGREVRAMVIGIPNVGKSCFINALAGRSSAKTGNRPGVKRSSQWIKVKVRFYLLDTPGILPPKFESLEDGVCLASLGCVKEEILDRQELCLELLKFMIKEYPALLEERYGIDTYGLTALEVYEAVGRRRGFLIKGGEIDYERTAVTVLDEFRNGKIGRITLERPREVTDQ